MKAPSERLKALILLAGTGSRLLPITKDTHKALLVVGKHPLLWYSISNLLDVGIDEIILVVGYKSNQIKEFIKNNFPDNNIKFVYNSKFLSTNSIYSYFLAKNYIKNNCFVRLEGDIYYSKKILKLVVNSKYDLTSAVEKKNKVSMEEYSVKVGSNSTIKKYGKDIPIKDSFGEAKGIEYISKKGSSMIYDSLVNLIKQGRDLEYAEICYQNIIDQGHEVHYVQIGKSDYWSEVDTVQDLNNLNSYIKKNVK